jgi:hypothetical protein
MGAGASPSHRDVQDRVHHLAEVRRARASNLLRGRHVGRDQRPFPVGQIACVALHVPPILAASGFNPGYRRLRPVRQPDRITIL